MGWLRRLGRTPPPVAAPSRSAAAPKADAGVERTSPGVAALFDGVAADGSHAILDLGPASEASLAVYSRYARKVRFADLLAAANEGGWTKALTDLPEQPDRPYDLLFAWDILDRLTPEERRRLITRLSQVSSPNARLFVGVDASGSPMAQPYRYMLLGVDRVRAVPTGPPRPAFPPLHSAEVEKLVAPFMVVRAFTLKGGLREYFAIRQERQRLP